ncbi:MAG: efflux RND transporter periplasmic adaptor subunit [Candidatus Aureabacteria bacterium]|nr:efflux RND transporter periplasmic adaptor subunit [Candidatus Auribacterota bacterium]
MKRKGLKNRKTVVVVLIFITGIAAIITYQMQKGMREKLRSQKQAKADSQKEETASHAPLVTVATIKKTCYKDCILGVTGKIDVARAKLGFEISGTIARILVDKGNPVKTGDLLAELNKDELLLKEKYKKNSLEGEQIELEKARRILEETQEKAKTGYIAPEKLKEDELNVRLKENKVKAAELELESALESLKKSELRAPFDGVVLEKKIELGENISSTREAFILLDIHHVYADIEINEKKLAHIEPGQPIEMKTNIHKQTITGTIESIVPAVQGKAMVLSARAKLDPTEASLLPGMFVTGDITIYEKKDCLVLPLKAVSKEDDSIFVFIADMEKKTAKKQIVSLAHVSRDEAVIKEGLNEGDQVIIETTQPLKDNTPIRIEETAG